MFKKIWVLCLTAILLINSTGCYPNGKKTTVNTKTENIEELNKTDIENLSFNFNLITPEKEEYSILSAKLKEFEDKTVEPLFLSKEIDNSNIIYEETDDYDEDGKKDYEFYIIKKDNNALESIAFNNESGYVSYLSNVDEEGNDLTTANNYIDLDTTFITNEIFREKFPLEKFEDFSPDNAISETKNNIEKLGIEIIGEPQIYALDKDNIEKNLSVYGLEYVEEMYLITYDIIYDELLFLRTPPSNQMKNLSGFSPSISAIYNKNGLVYFLAGKILTDLTPTKTIKICSAEKAANTVKANYELKKYFNPTNISGGQLYYISQVEYNSDGSIKVEIIPMWVFIIKEEVDNLGEIISTVCVNAETGNIYP